MARPNRKQRRQSKTKVAEQAGTPIDSTKVMKIAIPIFVLILLLVLAGILLPRFLRTENPTVTNPGGAAVQYGKNKITNDDLYYALKQNYGINVLTDMIDNELFNDYRDKLSDKEIKEKIYEQIINDIFDSSIPKDLEDVETLDVGEKNIIQYIEDLTTLSTTQENQLEAYIKTKANSGYRTNDEIIASYELEELRYLAAKDRFISQQINGVDYPEQGELNSFEADEDLLDDKQQNIYPDACVIIVEYKTPSDALQVEKYISEQLEAGKAPLDIYLELAAKRTTTGEEGELPNNIFQLDDIEETDEEDNRPDILKTNCANNEDAPAGLDSEYVHTVKYGDAAGSGISSALERYIFQTLKVVNAEVESYWNSAYATRYTSVDGYVLAFRANDIHYKAAYGLVKDASTNKYVENDLYNYLLDMVVEEKVNSTYISNFVNIKHLENDIKFLDTVLESRYTSLNTVYKDEEKKGKDGKILTVAGKTFTADQLYTELLNRYGIETAMAMLDKYIISDLATSDSYSALKLTKEEEKTAKETLDNQKAAYLGSGYASVISWEDYMLSQYNSRTKEGALQQIRFEMQMKKYLENYVTVSTDEIQKKYDDWFELSANHILFEVNNAHNDTNSFLEKTTEEIKAMLETDIAIQYMLAQRLLEQIEAENTDGFDKSKEIYWGLKTKNVVDLMDFSLKGFEYDDFISDIKSLREMLQVADKSQLNDDNYKPEGYDLTTVTNLAAFAERFEAEYGIAIEFDKDVDATFKDALVDYKFEISEDAEVAAMFKNDTEYAYVKSLMSMYEFNARINIEDVKTQELFELLMTETGGKGESLGAFGPGKMVPEFERAAKELASACTPDLVSGEYAVDSCSAGWNNSDLRTLTYSTTPVLTDFGFHFIFIVGAKEKEMPLTDESDPNYDSLFTGNSKSYEQFWESLEAQVKAEAKVESEVLVTIRDGKKDSIVFNQDVLKNNFDRFQEDNRRKID